MNWIKMRWPLFFTKAKIQQGDAQYKLVILVCISCFLITTSALFLAQVSSYLIAFTLIILFLLCSFVVVASKQNAEYQIRTLSNLIESMVDGDYSLRGRTQKNQPFQEVLNSVNLLASKLSKHKFEAKQSRLLLERIMEQMDAMVLATNEQGVVVMANASANKLILGNIDNLTQIKTCNIELATLPLGVEMIHANAGIINFKEGPISGEYFLSKEYFLSDGEQHKLYTLTNAERLLMEKERKAWQDLLRVLSHEMNNSLTPIAAISETMQKKLLSADHQCDKNSLLLGVNIIKERAESLCLFIASYSHLSYLAKPNKSTFKLALIINHLAALSPQCSVNCLFDTELLIHADKSQIEQVLINLIKNAAEAMENSEQKVIDIFSQQDSKWQHIIIRDSGCGIANPDNIFVPFYTTKSQGSGIGLALCRHILFNHNGLIKVTNHQHKQGVEVLISLPK